MSPRRIPAVTYRLQFNPDFNFSDARALAAYFSGLGISDLYASPIFRAGKGSPHGYDVVEPNEINPELGGENDFEELLLELRRYDIGWMQDIVPNHMAYDRENRMLMDALEKGRESPFFDYFDIEWDHPYEGLRGKVLAPFLGAFYGQCLDNGEIQLRYGAQELSVHYTDLQFPLNIGSYRGVFTQGLGALRKRLGDRHLDFVKLLGALRAFKKPAQKEDENEERAERIAAAKSLLWGLYRSSAEVREFIDANIARFNGTPGSPESFNALDQLLTEQLFRLSFWKVAMEEINYRRFFNINGLISLRMEDERVFEHVHALIFKLVQEEKITALRIDHIDGLYDPARYLARLRQKAGDLYMVVEKILALEEELPVSWPVQGTTGYDFTNYLNGIFCDPRNDRRFTDLYVRFSGLRNSYPQLVSEKKRLMIGKHMAGEVDSLARLLKGLSSRDRYGSDITLYGLRRALVELLTFFPVYRSYINNEIYSEEDRSRVEQALRLAKESNPGLLLELSFIERFLLLQYPEPLLEPERPRWIHFVMRFQQLTGPLTAEGFEDTALYVYNRLLSLNEVGGDPGRFGISLKGFHAFNQRRLARWPLSMNATATHDTKRGEDVRARINVLSEMPEEWEREIRGWSKINREKKSQIQGREVPDRNDEYFLYQTLVGGFPLDKDFPASFLERIKNYMIKAVREAKVHTAWLKPDLAYEEASLSFIEEILKPVEANSFLNAFTPFARKIAYYGMLNSLSQLLLKILAPGVPDFYQGTELWDLNFVDPDNRRPVDFRRRAEWLQELKRREREDALALIRDLLASWKDGRIKLYATYKALNFRRSQKELFQGGAYLPLDATGRAREKVCAFARRKDNSWALGAAPRLFTSLVSPEKFPIGREVWGENALGLPQHAPLRWLNVFTGQELEISPMGKRNALPLEDLFRHFPVALLAGTA